MKKEPGSVMRLLLTILLLCLLLHGSAGAEAAWNWDACCFWYGGKNGLGKPHSPPCETPERLLAMQGDCSAVGLLHDGERKILYTSGWSVGEGAALPGLNDQGENAPTMYSLLDFFCAIQATYGSGYVLWPDGEGNLCHGIS